MYLCITFVGHQQVQKKMGIPKGRLPKWMDRGRNVPELSDRPEKIFKINGVPIYKTNRHKRASETWRRNNPYCVACKNEGVVKFASVLDHIYPISMGGHPWSEKNYQSLCDFHHNRKRQMEGMGRVCEYEEFDGFRIPKQKNI